MKKLDKNTWSRKDQYNFFKQYELPFFNICTEVEVGSFLKFTRNREISFFIASLFAALKSANDIEEFRYRIHGDEVVIHEKLDAGSTILNPDNTFSFLYFDYYEAFTQFQKNSEAVLAAHKENPGGLKPRDSEYNKIHFSILPWYTFSGVSHPRRIAIEDSVPKIVFGKYHQKENKWVLPISIEVHHALMDGYHISEYLKYFQNILNFPHQYL